MRSGATALVSHAYPPYIHQITPSMSTTWTTPRHVASLVRTVVSCVIVKTKTRSKKSSSVETRTTSSACAGSATAEGEFLGLLGQCEPVVRRLVHLGPVLHRAA